MWWLKDGLLDSIDPEVVLLQVGTNDIKSGDIGRSPEETVAGIRTVVETIRAAKPDARLAQLQHDWQDVLVVDMVNAALARKETK